MRQIKFILRFGKGRYKLLVMCIAITLINVVVNISRPIAYKYMFDMLASDYSKNQFGMYVIILIMLLLVRTINLYIIQSSLVKFKIYTIKNLRNNIVAHIQRIKYKNISDYSSGDLLTRMNNDTDKIFNFIADMPDYVYQPIVFVCAIIYGFSLSPKLLCTTILVLILAMLFNNIIAKPLTKLSKAIQRSHSVCNTIVQDSIRGIHIVRAYNLEAKFITDYKSKVDDVFHNEIRLEKKSISIMALNVLVLMVPMYIINIYGGRLTFIDDMTIGEFTSFLGLTSYIVNPVGRIFELIRNYKITQSAISRAEELLNIPKEVQTDNKSIDNDKSEIIEFKDVCFSYSNNKTVLDRVSFSVMKNQKIAIVGASGCGKSTILNLLCRLYEADSGEINVLGKNINELDYKFLRKNIAVVSQDTYLYPVSVLENIRYGKLDATKQEVINAAIIAKAHDFITNLPNGYETILNQEGDMLSGGEKQRIAIARAILKETPILLLDESTSAIDAKNELHINNEIETINKTIIKVTHKLANVIDDYRIILIDKGKVVAIGHHKELIRRCAIYKDLYDNDISVGEIDREEKII